MTADATNTHERYYAALSNLFEHVTRDPAFNSNSALRESASNAQIALGKVEQWQDSLRSARNRDEERVFSKELQAAEENLAAAAISFLRKTINGDADTVSLAQELYDSLPADIFAKFELPDLNAWRDQIRLKQQQAKAPKLNLKRPESKTSPM